MFNNMSVSHNYFFHSIEITSGFTHNINEHNTQYRTDRFTKSTSVEQVKYKTKV